MPKRNLHNNVVLNKHMKIARVIATGLFISWISPIAYAQENKGNSKFEEGAIFLEADEIFQDAQNNQYIARGSVEARYKNRILRADQVIYYPNENKVHATGSVIVIEPDGNVEFADEVELNDDLATGVALGFFARLNNKATIGAAHAIHSDEGRRNTLKKAFYTACEACKNDDGSSSKPTWRLRAREAEQDLDNKMIYYRDAIFEIKGIPVFYSPYFAHADPTAGRRSGFLFPNIGHSGKYGFFYEQPYYKTLSASSDFTITPRVFTGVRPIVFGQYRKRFYSGGLQFDGGITHEQAFDGDGIKSGTDEVRGYFLGEGKFRIAKNWLWGFGAEYVSDDLLFRRYDLNPNSSIRGLFRNSSQRLSNQVFVVGQSDDFYASIAGIRYQGLRAGDIDDQLPIAAPLIDATKVLSNDFVGGKLSLGLNTAVLTRVQGINSRRASAKLDWSRRLVSKNGIIAKPSLHGRTDVYQIENQDFFADLGTNEQSFARALGVASLEVRWPWLKTGKNVNWIIEPIAHMSASPKGDRIGTYDHISRDAYNNIVRTPMSLLPNEDSLTVDFDESSLFRSSRFAGYDLWEDGLRASIGGRVSARWGEQGFASFSAGRVFRSTVNTNFGAGSSLQGKSSDYVAGISLTTGSTLNLASHVRFDQNNLAVRRFDILATSTLEQGDLGPLSQILHRITSSVQYVNVPRSAARINPLNEITFSTQTFITEHWGFSFNTRHDFERGNTQQYAAGLIYDDNCSRFELAFEHKETVDRGFTSGDSIKFRFTLTTLGTFGD